MTVSTAVPNSVSSAGVQGRRCTKPPGKDRVGQLAQSPEFGERPSGATTSFLGGHRLQQGQVSDAGLSAFLRLRVSIFTTEKGICRRL